MHNTINPFSQQTLSLLVLILVLAFKGGGLCCTVLQNTQGNS